MLTATSRFDETSAEKKTQVRAGFRLSYKNPSPPFYKNQPKHNKIEVRHGSLKLQMRVTYLDVILSSSSI